ncbi:MAG: sigma-54 dependent transcriptional regulator [Candidatus Poribacteria bacterium]|nr:sigma-54 dependent transcriptional regulator [Candidatus Poribacteria bacterium]
MASTDREDTNGNTPAKTLSPATVGWRKKVSIVKHIVIVSNVPDTAKEVKKDFEGMGYKVSIATDQGTQTSSLASDAILKIIHGDNADVLIPQQSRNVSAVIEGEASQVTSARSSLSGDYREIIGESPQIFEVLQHIENFAATPLRILIFGKTGTGKDLVARALHKNSGRSGKMVPVNCAAVPADLLESELFGHERGAFTSAHTRRIGRFERADKGTLFLDEIGEMPLAMQPKLLRAIEDSEIERVGGEKPIAVDVRIVAATNRDLAQAVKDGLFREDLYYRLNVASISLPTLAERREDIEDLVTHFLKKHRLSCDSEIPQIVPGTLALLESYAWPGNVRELASAVQRACYAAKEGVLLPEHLPEEIQMGQKRPVSSLKKLLTSENEQEMSFPFGLTLEAMEGSFIRATLAGLNGSRKKASEILGVSIRTLQRKLKKHRADD